MPGKKRLSQKEVNYAMDYLAVNLLYNDEINPGGNVSSGNKHISNNINIKKTEKLL